MIVSPKRRFAFVHIPKTGGTSFMTAYENRAAADDLLIGDTAKAKRRKHRLKDLQTPGRLWKHSTLADVGALVPEDFFVVTFVRNPWDRLVSYYHWLRAQSFDHPAVGRAKALTFPAFIRDTTIQDSVRNSPAIRYVTRTDGAQQCSLFARLEHPSDLIPLWDHLGFSLTIPRVNKSRRDVDWKIYYTSEEIEIVADLCALDIARFGYRPE